ncbi:MULTISPECIES: SRPBCC family protein [Rhodococcus]|jgi:uncharacterized protein YndB with AHSA1/START domain|uniref:SRPBCC domain-containing protein n=2 Tax=Rhodococcus TaxID=1827 RepID=X0QWW6_RHOWR|nr:MULTISPECIES: SRPBCC family protein [Rhodococcus]AII03220.1 hypothetical protein EP51_00520 [Rhodococcus opacus]GAF43090.1 hypothetical protein RW1_005_01990 [Rhodococcus wratislaviensis NBRC 100605]
MSDVLTQSITIATSPEEVWTLLTTLDAITGWYEEWDEIEHISSVESLKMDFTFRLKNHSKKQEVTCRVVEVDAPRRLSWNEYSDRGSGVRVSFVLAPDGAGSTVLTHSKRTIAAIDNY